jgi:hypothetical protein
MSSQIIGHMHRVFQLQEGFQSRADSPFAIPLVDLSKMTHKINSFPEGKMGS